MKTDSLPTIDQVNAAGSALMAKLKELQVHEEYIIRDYPMGYVTRGLCKLGVYYRKSNGWRTVRTTSRNPGRWATPKSSTYVPYPLIVVSGEALGDKAAGWLHLSPDGVFVTSATGQVILSLAEQPVKEPRLYGFSISGTEYPQSSPEHLLLWSIWTDSLAAAHACAESQIVACPAPQLESTQPRA